MPAPPEFRNTLGDIRIIKIFKEVKAKHPTQADRHIRISRKVKVNLEGKSQQPDPCGQNRKLLELHGGDLTPDRAHSIGDENFFAEACDKPFDAAGKIIEAFPAILKLSDNGAHTDDWPRNELREQRHIGAERDDIALHGDISTVQID